MQSLAQILKTLWVGCGWRRPQLHGSELVVFGIFGICERLGAQWEAPHLQPLSCQELKIEDLRHPKSKVMLIWLIRMYALEVTMTQIVAWMALRGPTTVDSSSCLWKDHVGPRMCPGFVNWTHYADAFPYLVSIYLNGMHSCGGLLAYCEGGEREMKLTTNNDNYFILHSNQRWMY